MIDSSDDLCNSEIRALLAGVKTIALVGASNNPARPSHYVMAFLQQQGFRVIPVNPGLAGQELLGMVVYPTLTAIPEPVDMVDMFRPAETAPALVEEAIAIGAKLFWMQLGLRHDAAAAHARAAGLAVVMDRCPKIELGG